MSARALQEGGRQGGGRVFFPVTAVDICRIEVKSAACLSKGSSACSGSWLAGIAQCLWHSTGTFPAAVWGALIELCWCLTLCPRPEASVEPK